MRRDVPPSAGSDPRKPRDPSTAAAALQRRWISHRSGVGTGMEDPEPRRLVHLELHTGDQAAAGAFYARLLSWKPESIETPCGSYLAIGLGGSLDGGIVECGTRRPLWLPYVEVDRIEEYTARAV